ncbi:MAG: hypothetical protein U0271_25055 [Polyangiaceae bacterium]
MAALLLCVGTVGSGCSTKSGGYEVIHHVPPFVITVYELRERVARTQHELGVHTSGVTVVGVLVRRALPCDPGAAAPGVKPCTLGKGDKFLFADPASPTRPALSAVLVDGGGLVEGQTYVIQGNVEVMPEVPERWGVRGQVLALVAP